jgi:hypothetical protein
MRGQTSKFDETSDEAVSARAVKICRGKSRLLELSLFLFVWSFCGFAINSTNLGAFNLQQAGVEAMVERKQFSLEGSSTPQLQIKVYYDGDKPFGDTFMHNGRQYAAKQPGQFMAGAVIYFFLRLLGLSYQNNYVLTSGLVSFFTSSLVTAAAALAVFRVAREFTSREGLWWPLASGLLYAFGTTAFAYSGFAYHDTLSSGYLVIAFYLALWLGRKKVQRETPLAPVAAAAAGLLLGVTVTTSMLPFFMACVLGVYLVTLRTWKITLAAFGGGLVGIAPLLWYNAISFDNPLLNSYSAGGYPESALHFNLNNSIEKIGFYASEITLYDPLVWLGVVGLLLFPRVLRREVLLIVALFAVHAFQVLNIESHGGCHYGPRFLLPALPYAAIGLIGLHYLRSRMTRRAMALAAVLVGAASIAINAVGAAYGAMYCDVQVYAFWPGMVALQHGGLKGFPLAKWLLVPVMLCSLLLVYSIRRYRKTAPVAAAKA